MSNFLLNKIFLLIEEKATTEGNRVSALNSDIFLRMTKPSTETFHQLYPNMLDSGVILAPFNHGRHWCLVVVNVKEKMSIYIDSLYNGAGAKMAFTQINNFLTCSASITRRNWSMQNWEYFVIPSSDIAQQLNSVDCGVFVAKWAQHISLGSPLDFTQDQMVTLRYSLILDRVRNSLSLDIKAPTQNKKEMHKRGTAARPCKYSPSEEPDVKTKKADFMISNKCAKEPALNKTSTFKSTAAHKDQMGAQASGKASTVNSASGKAKRLQSANAATDKSQLSTPSIPATSGKNTSGQRKILPLYKLNDQAPSGLITSESRQGPTSNKSNNKATAGPQTCYSGKTHTTNKANNKASTGPQTCDSEKTLTTTKSNKQATNGPQTSESGKTHTTNKSHKQASNGPQTSESGKTLTTNKSNKQATNGPQTSESGKTHTTTKSNNYGTTAPQTSEEGKTHPSNKSNNKGTTGPETSESGTTHTSNKSSNQANAGTKRKCLASTTNQPNIPSANVTPSTHAAIHSSTHDDHCYTDVVPPKKRKIDPTDLPTNVAAILPLEYEYKCIEFEDLPEQMQHSFKVRFCVKDISCKEEVDNWLSKLAISSIRKQS